MFIYLIILLNTAFNHVTTTGLQVAQNITVAYMYVLDEDLINSTPGDILKNYQFEVRDGKFMYDT